MNPFISQREAGIARQRGIIAAAEKELKSIKDDVAKATTSDTIRRAGIRISELETQIKELSKPH